MRATFISLLLALTLIASGREVRVSWDANPPAQSVLGYRLYVGGVLTAATTNTTWLLVLPDTTVSVSLTAFNAAGESMHAGPLVIPAGIPAPLVTVERSKDLVNWSTLTSITAQNYQVLRVKITPRTGAAPLVDLEQTNDGLTWSLITSVPYDPPEFFRLHNF